MVKRDHAITGAGQHGAMAAAVVQQQDGAIEQRRIGWGDG